MSIDRLLAFVTERHRIHLSRAAGDPPDSWTTDPILRQYRFCNIYRELDTVTRWLAEEWREPHADDPDLWHAFVVARNMNNIPLLSALDGPPLPWSPEPFRAVCAGRQARGEKVFSGAYMIGTRHNGSKADYLADMVFTPLWSAREKLRPLPGDTLTGFHMSLCLFYGLASFLAAQVVADIKYVEPLLSARDWHTFCASGPGSRKGLNAVLSRPFGAGMREDEFRLRVSELREAMLPHFRAEGWEEPHAQDVQNMLCEYFKYEKARLGLGRPKQLFRGGAGEVNLRD